MYIGLQADLMPENDLKPSKTGKTTTPTAVQAWPNILPAQVSAAAQLLASANSALSLSEIEVSFKGKGRWTKGLRRILETLEALGRARRRQKGENNGWQGFKSHSAG